MQACLWAVFATALPAGTAAQAELKFVSDAGFAVTSMRIERDSRALCALIVEPALWWSSEHSYGGMPLISASTREQVDAFANGFREPRADPAASRMRAKSLPSPTSA